MAATCEPMPSSRWPATAGFWRCSLRSLANVGAYATGAGLAIQLLIGPWVQTSVYDIPAIDFHFKAVLTNTAPTGAYRGAGRPEAIFIIERLMDEAARQTGIDRVALRRRNFIRPEQMPYKNADGPDLRHRPVREDHGSGAGAGRLERLRGAGGAKQGAGQAARPGHRHLPGMDGRQRARGARDGHGAGRRHDRGVLARSTRWGRASPPRWRSWWWTCSACRSNRCSVVLGDTDRGDGFGSAGSRSLFTGGSALRIGAREDAGPGAPAGGAGAGGGGRRPRIRARAASRSRAPTSASTCSRWPAASRNSASTWQAPLRCRARAGPMPATSARWRSTRRPARSRWWPTPASTTSAGWSTR